jgi:hypothetical protein
MLMVLGTAAGILNGERAAWQRQRSPWAPAAPAPLTSPALPPPPAGAMIPLFSVIFGNLINVSAVPNGMGDSPVRAV